MTTQTLLDFDLGESSSDSDFRIEDHDDDSDDCSLNSNDDQSDQDDSDDSDDDDDDDDDEDAVSENEFANLKGGLLETKRGNENISSAQLLAQAKAKDAMDRATAKMLFTPICCACLGDRSDDTNEIVECDNCGISVHEGCYGISDSGSVSSTVSSCSTEPWFCEACKANIVDPVCELCPNKGGIFKETDVGKWVHLVCALYVPGVAFGELDQLSSVTLFEMPYSKWGAKTCSLCEDVRYARCGVCIGCDAGMCKTFFHVTCAQAAGLLSETHSEEADHADPFYAHCKIHSDKTLIKHRKRNFNALKMKMNFRKTNAEQKSLEESSPDQKRIERKLKKHRNKYVHNKMTKSEPWVPTQKMPRSLTTSASACRRLIRKAEMMGMDVAALEFQETQMAALADVRKKWHVPPAFSVEFIGYYLDRTARTKQIKKNLQQQLELNQSLINEQKTLREKYDEAIRVHSEQMATKNAQNEAIQKLHAIIQTLCPNKTLALLTHIAQPATKAPTPIPVQPQARPMSVPTAAALKMGVGFPLTNLPGTNDDTNRILSTQCQNNSELLHECGICKRINDQHLLVKCDTCSLHYHLGCLSPPLTRHPKKSKIYGWQCSECDEDNPDGVVQLTTGPRKSRTKYSKDGTIVPVDSSRDVSIDESADDEKSTSLPLNNSERMKSPQSEAASTVKTPSIKCDMNRSNNSINGSDSKSQASEDAPTTINTNNVIKNATKRRAKKSANGSKKSSENKKVSEETPKALDVQVNGIKPTITEEKTENHTQAEKTSTSIGVKRPHEESDTSIVEHQPEVAAAQRQKSKSSKKAKKGDSKSSEVNDAATSVQQPEKISSIVNNVETSVETTPPIVSHVTNGLSESKESENSIVVRKRERKRRKEKHRNKHDNTGDRSSSSKEHKKKRKRKSRDMENPSYDGVPKIKIKFKALPLPGETAPESHCFYVPANMVRPRDFSRSRPASVNSIDETTSTPVPSESPAPSAMIKSNASTPSTPSTSLPSIRTRRASVLLSPTKMLAKRNSTPITVISITSSEDAIDCLCDVCQISGSAQDLVKCDECRKNYHFRCLDPPLKKTPKRRGYSWHCADCDPTDKEDN